MRGPQVISIGTSLSGDGEEEGNRLDQQQLTVTGFLDSLADDEMPVLVKCPQVSSKGPSLSGDGEEKGAGKETRPITTDSDWIPQYFPLMKTRRPY